MEAATKKKSLNQLAKSAVKRTVKMRIRESTSISKSKLWSETADEEANLQKIRSNFISPVGNITQRFSCSRITQILGYFWASASSDYF